MSDDRRRATLEWAPSPGHPSLTRGASGAPFDVHAGKDNSRRVAHAEPVARVLIPSRPRLLPEDRYVMGRVLRSGRAEGNRLSVRRTTVQRADPETALTWGGARGCVARLNLVALPAGEIKQGRTAIQLLARAAMETSFRNVEDSLVWPMAHAIDQITFDLPQTAVVEWAEDHAIGKAQLPDALSGTSAMDPALRDFGLAVLPVLHDQATPNQFFVDHILDGVCSYIFGRFVAEWRPVRSGLANWQERRAKEMLSADGTHLRLTDIAAACGLSVAHFSRAFRKSCGVTPHSWLMSRRIEKAQVLLKSTDTPLSLIAAECGFADQAHLTNTFSKHTGGPPGAFRRYWHCRDRS